MAAPSNSSSPSDSVPAPVSNLRKLKWQSQWGYQTATDSQCYYIRESSGSMIAAWIFSIAIVGASGWMAVNLFLFTPGKTWMEIGFGLLMLLVAAVFIYIPWLTLRKGRWMVVHDRGAPGIPGEIRYQGKRLPADRVKSFSTRSCGGNPPRSSVVVELHDGSVQYVGPIDSSTWPAHYAQQAATWMGLPFRHGS